MQAQYQQALLLQQQQMQRMQQFPNVRMVPNQQQYVASAYQQQVGGVHAHPGVAGVNAQAMMAAQVAAAQAQMRGVQPQLQNQPKPPPQKRERKTLSIVDPKTGKELSFSPREAPAAEEDKAADGSASEPAATPAPASTPAKEAGGAAKTDEE